VVVVFTPALRVLGHKVLQVLLGHEVQLDHEDQGDYEGLLGHKVQLDYKGLLGHKVQLGLQARPVPQGQAVLLVCGAHREVIRPVRQ